jgi:RimJ/RimL family protein N-acetyltransferase
MNLSAYPIQVALRGGAQVRLRPMEPKDGPGVLDFFRALPEEDRLFLRDDVTSDEWLDRFVRQIDYTSMVPLVAEHAGKGVGNAALYRAPHGWSAHVGEIRVAVARAFQGKGLGTLMARELRDLVASKGRTIARVGFVRL